jgi:hypothetical protein
MTKLQPAPRPRSHDETERLSCSQCEALMEIAPFVPGLGHLAHRIFGCSNCGHILIKPK